MRGRRRPLIAKLCRSRSMLPSRERLAPSVLSHVPSLLPVVCPPRSRLASPSRSLSTAITPLRLGTSPRWILHRCFWCPRRNARGPDLGPSSSSSPDAHASVVHSHRLVAAPLHLSSSQMDSGSIFAIPAFFESCLDGFVTESSGSSTSLRRVRSSVKVLTL